MEVLYWLVWLYVAAAEFPQDFAHIEAFIKQKKYVLKKKYRPLYHISAPTGWLSHPAGFTYFNYQYHVFYQYYPYDGAWGPLRWGHAVSDDLVDWVYYPDALVPKEHYDKNGCSAGTAVVHKGYLTLFYTGNVMSNNKTYQTQNVAISSDGLLFQKYLYNPVIKEPPPGVKSFRNPKVWKYRHRWYMIVGTSSLKLQGQIALYSSPDLFRWSFNGIVTESYGDMGYTWGSPDFFELDGQQVLVLSVQGVQMDGYRFRNLFQTGYVLGKFDYTTGKFEDLEISTATLNELDYGHDFYAAQTIQATDGRRLLIAWLGMWESAFEESNEGWASMLTLVRELKLNPQGRILMTPVREAEELRSEKLEDAWYSPGEAFQAGAKTFELIANTTTVSTDMVITLEWSDGFEFTITYSPEHGYVSVDRGGSDGVRRADWLPMSHIQWRIFVDSSSIEVFCGWGEVVFTSRIYPTKMAQVRIDGDTQIHIIQYRMKKNIGYDKKIRKYLKKKCFEEVLIK